MVMKVKMKSPHINVILPSTSQNSDSANQREE